MHTYKQVLVQNLIFCLFRCLNNFRVCTLYLPRLSAGVFKLIYVRKTALALLLFIAAAFAKAQEFNYVHLDTRDGLAGSTVYDMCQDKDGFMWFATENGLSRFDGSGFKNYTVQDGLPDNEVLKLFADSRGRIWIGSFNKEVCYYFRGKIYNKKNDTLLSKIKLRGFLGAIIEDEEGVIAFSDFTEKVIILEPFNTSNPVSELSFQRTVGISSFNSCSGKRIMIGDDLNAYVYREHAPEYLCAVKDFYDIRGGEMNNFNSYISCDRKIKRSIRQKPNYISISGSQNYLTFCNTYDGAWSVDTAKNEWDIHYLEGKKITNTIIDAEKNTWFSTIGEGVYKLPSPEIRTIRFPEVAGINNNEVFSILKYGNEVIAGLNHGNTASVINQKFEKINWYGAPPHRMAMPQTNRLYSVKKLSDNSVLLGFDLFLVRVVNNKKEYSYIYPVKSMDEINKDSIILGTSSFAFIMRTADLKITDTVWRGRCTKVFYHAGKYYIGTLNGLSEVYKDKSHTYLGNLHPSLARRITDIKTAKDGTLWIATADQGVVGLKNNRIAGILKDTNGLSSNMCRTLFLQDDYLWVGTNKGLNKIDISNKAQPVITYSSSDGLPSDIINTVYAEDTIVYVGSPAGLTVFNETKISSYSICRLSMLGITVSGQHFDSLHAALSYKRNNIRFNYIGVSLKSAGDITYWYKLKGLNEEWIQTTQTTLDYPSLPAGDYEFQLYAVNKYGIKSETITVRFSINAPFWKSVWFYILLALFTAALAGWMVHLRNKKYNRKLKETNALQKQFAAMEQQALQAQMNPHFIFNCLNGIQQYILTGNKEKANEYLTCFARLIRQTLDNSGKKTISVTQEVQYLTEYLEMEKMRSGNAFTYNISIDNNTDAAGTEIPAMLLQPYVENALRHGLRYKTNGTGEVMIRFEKNEKTLLCIVRDNGVGRKYAQEMKGKQHIEYQSKGMNLTARRIELLNKINDVKMAVVIKDLYHNDHTPAGTEVIIQIPL